MPELPRTIQRQRQELCSSFNIGNHTWRNAREALSDFKEQVGFAPFYQYKEQIKDELQAFLGVQLPNCTPQQVTKYAKRAINAVDRRFRSFY